MPSIAKSAGLVVRCHRSWPTFEHFAQQVVIGRWRLERLAEMDRGWDAVHSTEYGVRCTEGETWYSVLSILAAGQIGGGPGHEPRKTRVTRKRAAASLSLLPPLPPVPSGPCVGAIAVQIKDEQEAAEEAEEEVCLDLAIGAETSRENV